MPVENAARAAMWLHKECRWSYCIFGSSFSIDKDLTLSLRLMKEIVHPNILHARLTHKNDLPRLGVELGSEYWSLVELYTDTVFEYMKMCLGIHLTVKSGMVVLLTDNLRSIVRYNSLVKFGYNLGTVLWGIHSHQDAPLLSMLLPWAPDGFRLLSWFFFAEVDKLPSEA